MSLPPLENIFITQLYGKLDNLEWNYIFKAVTKNGKQKQKRF